MVCAKNALRLRHQKGKKLTARSNDSLADNLSISLAYVADAPWNVCCCTIALNPPRRCRTETFADEDGERHAAPIPPIASAIGQSRISTFEDRYHALAKRGGGRPTPIRRLLFGLIMGYSKCLLSTIHLSWCLVAILVIPSTSLCLGFPYHDNDTGIR